MNIEENNVPFLSIIPSYYIKVFVLFAYGNYFGKNT